MRASQFDASLGVFPVAVVELYLLPLQLYARARRLQCGLPRSSSESAPARRLAGHVDVGRTGLIAVDERWVDAVQLLDGPPAAVSTSVDFPDARASHGSAPCRARIARPGRASAPSMPTIRMVRHGGCSMVVVIRDRTISTTLPLPR